MSYTRDINKTLDMIPFEEALREMESRPLRNEQTSRLATEMPLVLAVAALFALYFVG